MENDKTPPPPQGKGGDLKARVLSSLILAPAAAACIYFGGWPFAAMVAVSAAAMAYEWDRVTFGGGWSWRSLPGMVGIPVALGLLGLGLTGNASILLLGVVALCGLVTALSGRSAGWGLLGAAYIGVPCLSLLWLRNQPEQGLMLTIWLFVIVWATDTGAYFAGRTIGGPKIAPRISPKKTWAGLLGGMACAGLAGAALSALSHETFFDGASMAAVAVLSAVLAVVSQAGDFAESAWKRRFGVKDSSHLIPGHGGVFDRIDGILFVAPLTALLFILKERGFFEWL